MSIAKLKFTTLPDPYLSYMDYKTCGEGQRFGQFMCNNYLKPGQSWPDLYYANEQEAFELLYPSR